MRTFPGNNTAQGFFSYYDDLLAGKQRIFLLKGGPGTGKSSLMRRVGAHFQDKGYGVDWHHCSGDPLSLDAVSIPALGALIADATMPHALEPRSPGIREEIVALGNYWDRKQLVRNQTTIQHLDQQRRNAYKDAYTALKQAGVARAAMAEALQPQAYQLLPKLRACKEEIMTQITSSALPSTSSRCFFTAITCMGIVSLVPLLVAQGAQIYMVISQYVGWSEFIAHIAYECRLHGVPAMLLADPLEPHQWEGIYLPQQQHLYIQQPYSTAVTGQLYDKQLLTTLQHQPFWADLTLQDDTPWQRSIDLHIQEAQQHLHTARTLHQEIETYYTPAMDFDGVAERGQTIIRELDT